MHFFTRQTDSDLEARLRAERPEPSAALIHAIAALTGRLPHVRRSRSLRLAFAVVSTTALVALGYGGGVGYAASSVTHAASAVKKVFVGKSESTASRKEGASKSAAADQYGGPPTGPFLPPDTTPDTVLDQASNDVGDAINDLQDRLNCDAKTGAARQRCLRQQRALESLGNRIQGQIDRARERVADLPADRRAAVDGRLAIHLQQRQNLLDGQETRRTRCQRADQRNRPACRNLDQRDATELIRLTHLQQIELNNLLSRLGA